jgi:hypothetical protein
MTATALYAFTPASSGGVAAATAGMAAVSVLSISSAEAKDKLRGRSGKISLKQ